MSETSRRRFLGVAGAGAAAAGVSAVPGIAHAQTLHKNAADGAVVAYVRDARASELTLLVGEREVVVRDRDLVTRLLNAAGR